MAEALEDVVGSGGDFMLASSDIVSQRINPALLRTEKIVGDWKNDQFIIHHDYGMTASVEIYKQQTFSGVHGWVALDPSRYTAEFIHSNVYIFCKFTPARNSLKIVVRP